MLSALIPSEHSYSAVHLVAKPIDQRFVQPGPLVLGSTSLRYYTPAVDKDQPVSRFLVVNRIGLYLYRLHTKGMHFGSWRIVSEGSITTSLLVAHYGFPAYSQLVISVFLQDAAVNQCLNLGFRPFKNRIVLNSVSKRSKPSSRTLLIGEQPNPWDLLQPQDRMSRHRGAEHRRRYGLSGGTSLLSPG